MSNPQDGLWCSACQENCCDEHFKPFSIDCLACWEDRCDGEHEEDN